MIRTLFAQEFRITRKWLLVSVGVALVVAFVGYSLALFSMPVLSSVGLVIGILATSIITPLVMGILVASYWRTMYGSEGYFTMTLPVRGRNLYWVKVIYGFAVVVLAAIITVLAVFGGVLIFAGSEGATVSEFTGALSQMVNDFGWGIVWFLIVCILLQLAFTVIAGATIMSVGAQGRFNHLGFGAPVIGAILLYVAMQIITFASMLFIPFSLKFVGSEVTIVSEGMWNAFVESVTDPNAGDPEFIGLGIVPVSLILTVLFAWLGARSVDRRTSLR